MLGSIIGIVLIAAAMLVTLMDAASDLARRHQYKRYREIKSLIRYWVVAVVIAIALSIWSYQRHGYLF